MNVELPMAACEKWPIPKTVVDMIYLGDGIGDNYRAY